jgi:hypothetical protein
LLNNPFVFPKKKCSYLLEQVLLMKATASILRNGRLSAGLLWSQTLLEFSCLSRAAVLVFRTFGLRLWMTLLNCKASTSGCPTARMSSGR